MGNEYLITLDITPALQNMLKIPLSFETKGRLLSFEHELARQFWQHGFVSPEDRQHSLSSGDISTHVYEALAEEPRPVVSFDVTHFPTIRSVPFSITRLTSPVDPSQYKFGPRKGHEDLPEQIEILSKDLNGSAPVILDIGTYSGGSIVVPILSGSMSEDEKKLMIEHGVITDKTEVDAYKGFRAQGIMPQAVYMGVGGKRAVEALRALGIETHVLHEFEFRDWIELRDVIGVDGRKVDETYLSEAAVAKSQTHQKFIPYRERPEDWATILPKKHEEFVKWCDKSFDQLCSIVKEGGITLERVQLDPAETAEGSLPCYFLRWAYAS